MHYSGTHMNDFSKISTENFIVFWVRIIHVKSFFFQHLTLNLCTTTCLFFAKPTEDYKFVLKIVVRVTLALTYDHETSSVVYLAISNMPTIYDHSASNSII